MRLDIVSLHEISIKSSSFSVGIFPSVGLGAGPLIELPKGGVREGSSEGNQIFQVFLY